MGMVCGKILFLKSAFICALERVWGIDIDRASCVKSQADKKQMNENDVPEWQHALQGLRKKASKTKNKSKQKQRTKKLNEEAVMTLVAIMKDQEDPRLQLSAAKTLLQKSSSENESQHNDAVTDCHPHEIDAAIAVAKALLDELARRKAACVSGTGQMGDGSARKPTDP